MPYPQTLRGDINTILNPMVRDRAISVFSTNLVSKPSLEQTVIRVSPKEGDDSGRVEREAQEALAGLSVSLDVQIDPLSDVPEIEGCTVSIPPENLKVGKCCLLHTGHVRRVIRIMPDGRVQFEHRMGHTSKGWKTGIQEGRSFAVLIEREVPCDWNPETDEDRR